VRRLARLGALLAGAMVLSGCTLVSTSTSPTIVNSNDVPLGLLDPTIPFTDFARVIFVERDVYMANKSDKLVAVGRLMTSPPNLTEVLHYVLLGPTAAEQSRGIITQLPSTLVLNQATPQDGVALIDVGSGFRQIPLSEQRVAVAQLLFSAQQAGITKGIRLSINQTPFNLTLDNGETVSLITPADLAYLK
jgi:hypothetical protein